MVKVVQIGPVTIGKQTKVAVPIVATTIAEIMAQAQYVKSLAPDLIEWRIDSYQAVTDWEQLDAWGLRLQQEVAPLPLLVTYRTVAEGGAGTLEADAYQRLLQRLVQASWVQAVDVEWNTISPSSLQRLQQSQCPLVLSQHHFQGTPPLTELRQTLQAMAASGVDVVKMATMPHTAADVLTLLAATDEARQTLGCPLVTMAMGDLGKLTRVTGNLFGSAITFATGKQQSAPGQLSVTTVRELLETFGGSNTKVN
ncbi:type I 3-dehydroquinate dehydratase [Fructilactobacillus myrtifloralis]|uniref:3-dehydroquinate dehydratase n=1 Tax=Fructilactobacillus myrtifloralis TaxID=2940301 RepID=A0ABY5BLG1_9LACO|nr:type I 3-dehydroquinate dehydratase [Fructilactobacillus myrtifloralis]USS84509.1 type I 3-dehydroquinate dehydratase [Fructilactobacillus myrtifloralis]